MPEHKEATVNASDADQRKGRLAWFVLLLVLANFVWAAQPAAVKYVEPFLGPFAIAILPFFVVTPLLLPLLSPLRRRDAVRPTRRDWMRFIVAGVGGQVLCQVGMTWGMAIGLASNCAILYLLIPVITAVLASLMLKERVTPLRIVCLAIGLAGVLLMSAQDLRNAKFFQSNYFLGNVLMLVGCLGASFYNVYCKGLMQKFHERDILIYSYITASAASIFVLLWREPDCFVRLPRLDVRAWAALAFLALFVYGISMVMFFHVLQHLPVTVALASTYLVPVFGVLIAVILLGERLNGLTMAGAAVVLAATVLIMKYDAGIT